ncbi:hypothetical protein [Isoptericola haloaureus]|uniref:Transcriptional regulator, AbiEi antitoxin, Type IV TA system n=1 Tax=Isoptericola haloaureus TaxID=1542902 RepID=A0ABU7Z3B4_9MICO
MAPREPAHAPAVRRLTTILAQMRAPDSPLRGMLSADRLPPLVPLTVEPALADVAAIRRRLETGHLAAVRGSLVPTSPDDGHEGLILREVRGLAASARGEHWFSHSTAALLHGAWTYATPPLVHVTHEANPHVRRRLEPDVRRHHTRLLPRDRDVVDGIPVTSKERTLVDCLRTMWPAAALVVADSLFRLRADPAEVSRIMADSVGKRGMVQARRLLELCDPRSGSPGETVARLAAVDDGLPRPVCQMPVETRSGTRYVDFGWPEVGAGVEFDGDVKYSGGEYGLPDDVLRRQQQRHEDIEAAGVDLVRVRWPALRDTAQLGLEIRGLYERAFFRAQKGRRRPA